VAWCNLEAIAEEAEDDARRLTGFEYSLIKIELRPIYVLFMQTPQRLSRAERTEHATPHRYRDNSDTYKRTLL
jgi:hypothetical protein